MIHLRNLMVALLLGLLLSGISAYSQSFPPYISYQGRAVRSSGEPMSDGTYPFTFALYDDPDKGNLVWHSEVNIEVRDGLFFHYLGSRTPFPLEIFMKRALFLEISLDGVVMGKRIMLVTVPYAFRSIWSDTAEYAKDGAGGSGDITAVTAGDGLSGGGTSGEVTLSVGTGQIIESMIADAAVSSTKIINNTITNSDISNSAAIESSKISGTAVNLSSEQTITATKHFTNEVTIGSSTNANNRLYVTSSYSPGVDNATAKISNYSTSGTALDVLGQSLTVPAAEIRNGTSGPLLKCSNSYGMVLNVHAGGINAYAYNGSHAARFYGNVGIYAQDGTQELLVELGEGLDYAEGFNVKEDDLIEPGTVLCIDNKHPGELCLSQQAYDTRVAGIVAGANNLGSGVRLGTVFEQDVALAGRVYCKVDATYGEIKPGDLLTTSPTPGYAMVVTDHMRAQGAILGKAMEALEEGETGQILVLVTLQ